MRELIKKEREVSRKKEWREVHRSTEVIAIGDLHGNWDAFTHACEVAGIGKALHDGNYEWTGGSKRVVFAGDILADRHTDGLRILDQLTKLQAQAERAGGKISILAGNHDTWFMAYLLEANCENRTDMTWINTILSLDKQSRGLTELKKYSSSHQGTFTDSQTRHEIQEEAKKDVELWAQLKKYQLLEVHDDTLFLHCNPTEKILAYLLERADQATSLAKAVEKINAQFQEAIKDILGGSHEARERWTKLVNIFTATDNRKNNTVPILKSRMRNHGINAIIHGHSRPDENTPYKPEDLLIVSADRGYGRSASEKNGEDSLLIITTQGAILDSYQGKREETSHIRS